MLVGHVLERVIDHDEVENRFQIRHRAAKQTHVWRWAKVTFDERVDADKVLIVHVLQLAEQPAPTAADIQDARREREAEAAEVAVVGARLEPGNECAEKALA